MQMTQGIELGTWARFLLGDRDAILQLARSRHTLWIGAIFVLAAGLAREYDQEDLLRSPWYLLIPFVASIALSLALLLILHRWRGETRPFWIEYRAFLGLFWMTAPLALVYGIPYERFLSSADAVSANLWTLLFVAVWRLLLMSRVAAVFTNQSLWTSFALIMPVADCVVLVGLAWMPVPLLNVMGGIQLTDAEARLSLLHFQASFLSGVSLFLWGPLGGIAYACRPSRALPMLSRDESPPPRGLLILAIAMVLLWVPFLPARQGEQRLASKVDRAMKKGDIAGAIDEMSRHARTDFPPQWSPPPLIGWRDESPEILDVIDALIAHPEAAGWVREVFIDKFERRSLSWGGPHGHYYTSEEINRVLNALPEGPALRRKHSIELDVLKEISPPATQP